jgi:myo-inositol-1(or 4)-monophosphatase
MPAICTESESIASLNAAAVNGEVAPQSANRQIQLVNLRPEAIRTRRVKHVRSDARRRTLWATARNCPERDTLDFDEPHLKCQAAIDFRWTHGTRAARTLWEDPRRRPNLPNPIPRHTLAVARTGLKPEPLRSRNSIGRLVQDDLYRDIALQAARAGGEVLRQWSHRFTVHEKGPANLVTEADFASQETIVGIIRSQFPSHGFLGEEGLDRPADGQPFRWIIDPLDGTGNYVHGFPYFAVSIGLEYAGEMQVGVIYDPTRDEMFVAQQGRGAWLNEHTIRPSAVEDLEKAFVVASLPSAVDADHPSVRHLLRVLPRAQTVQRTGSAALNLAYVACGRIDAFWSTSLKPWDVAAGALIVAEAGGKMSATGGAALDINVPDLLATNGSPIHSQLIDLLTGPIES